MNAHLDSHIGITGHKVYFMKSTSGKNMYWCRMPFAIFGNFPEHQDLSKSPFEKYYIGNFVEGKGETKQKAIEAMNKEIDSIAESLWY